MTEYEVDMAITGRIYVNASSWAEAEQVAIQRVCDECEKGPLKHVRMKVDYPMRRCEDE